MPDLIAEIEAAEAKFVADDLSHAQNWNDDTIVARVLMGHPYWKRLKAALEAAKEMDALLERVGSPRLTSPQRKFRAATGDEG